MSRLAEILDRYGEAVVADLGLRGWDVVELWEDQRYAFTLTLIDHLPRTSSYAQAVSEDDDAAPLLDQLPRQTTPSVRDWSPEVEVLAAIFDRLTEQVNTLIRVNGGNATQVRPWPRPHTALDRYRTLRNRQAAADLEAKLFAGR